MAEFLLNETFTTGEAPSILSDNFMHYLMPYINYILKLKESCQWIEIEKKLHCPDIHENFYGTADCIAYDNRKKILHVVDLKFGKNIIVEVKNNLQLEYYALGVLKVTNFDCETIRSTIVQPRAYHPDGIIRWQDIDIVDFVAIESRITREIEATEQEDAELKAGSHCLFCKAKNICPAYNKNAVKEAQKIFARQPTDPKTEFKVI